MRRPGEQVDIALMEPSLVDRRCLLEADRPRSGLRDDAFMSAFALFRCEDLPVSYPSKVEIGGKVTAAATSGPAHAALPTSSTPAMRR